jgi:cytoskeletal protein CcmA (bactofilin family)
MWNRDDSQKSQPSNLANQGSKMVPAAPTLVPVAPPPLTAVPPAGPLPAAVRTGVAIGLSLLVKGELTGSEDLLIEGRVEGKISLPEHLLTIGPHAKISAEVVAKVVIIQGSIIGNVTASERFEIKAGGRMTGDLTSPKVIMAEGSDFRGSVDMRHVGASRAEPTKGALGKPVAV